jgi:SAM domain (Sterile alpha motif)
VQFSFLFIITEANQIIFLLDNEITGKVLLKLDVDLLKSEIGITAFGKRTQVMDSITDLCQLPSVTCSGDHSTDAIPQSQSGSQSESYLHTTVQGPNQRHLFVEKFNMQALCLLLLVLLGMLGLLLHSLRSFIADGNGEGRVSRLVETGGAKGFHNNGRDGWLSVLFGSQRSLSCDKTWNFGERKTARMRRRAQIANLD